MLAIIKTRKWDLVKKSYLILGGKGFYISPPAYNKSHKNMDIVSYRLILSHISSHILILLIWHFETIWYYWSVISKNNLMKKPNLKIKELMDKEGISRATAFRRLKTPVELPAVSQAEPDFPKLTKIFCPLCKREFTYGKEQVVDGVSYVPDSQ